MTRVHLFCETRGNDYPPPDTSNHGRTIAESRGPGRASARTKCCKITPRRLAHDHRGVAEAIRCGWADVGVCVRLVSEEAGLQFLSVGDEAYLLCYPTALESDPRLRALLTVLRSRTYRGWLTDLPGYDCKNLGATSQIQ